MVEESQPKKKSQRGETLMIIIPIITSLAWSGIYSYDSLTFWRCFAIFLPAHVVIFYALQFIFFIFKIKPGKPFKVGFYWGILVAGPTTLYQVVNFIIEKAPMYWKLDLSLSGVIIVFLAYLIPGFFAGTVFGWAEVLWFRYRKKMMNLNPYKPAWILAMIISAIVVQPMFMSTSKPILDVLHAEFYPSGTRYLRVQYSYFLPTQKYILVMNEERMSETQIDLFPTKKLPIYTIKRIRNPFFELYLARNQLKLYTKPFATVKVNISEQIENDEVLISLRCISSNDINSTLTINEWSDEIECREHKVRFYITKEHDNRFILYMSQIIQ